MPVTCLDCYRADEPAGGHCGSCPCCGGGQDDDKNQGNNKGKKK